MSGCAGPNPADDVTFACRVSSLAWRASFILGWSSAIGCRERASAGIASPLMCISYSIVKDSSADLGVNFKIVQNRPTVKAVCTKISKKTFLHICQYFYISERK